MLDHIVRGPAAGKALHNSTHHHNDQDFDVTLIDISPTLSPDSPIFPGDTPFSATRSWAIDETCPVNVSRLTMSSHGGAHADAPLHYDRDGSAIEKVSLEPYLGACVVIDVSTTHGPVSVDMVKQALGDRKGIESRVLIKTYAQQPKNWDDQMRPILAATIEWLATNKCVLIGVDTQSLDAPSSKTMDAHHAVKRADMRIPENLLLDDVTPGRYELIALPLKLKGVDAAPVRAVLRTLP